MPTPFKPTRRQLLQTIGKIAGGSALYGAMTQLGLANGSDATTVNLQGAKPGSTVLILGAGLAGMVSAYELQKAGYQVQILEFNDKPGGRCITLRGGDTVKELGAPQQTCQFDRDQYFNPGPWRIPYNHRGVMDYCKKLGIQLQPFIQLNHNAYIHDINAFGGKPMRYGKILADTQGATNELLAKVVNQKKLDQVVSVEDQEKLLEALRTMGSLDAEFKYRAGDAASHVRGYEKPPGAGIGGRPTDSQPMGLSDILRSGMWSHLTAQQHYDMQMPMFQPVGGMDAIAQAFAKQLEGRIQYRSRVTALRQNDQGVSAVYEDLNHPGKFKTVNAQWCVCTIPLSILGQLELGVSPEMQTAIQSVAYASSVKVGLQFKRRFWEEDENIYGGNTSTNLPIGTLGYPSSNFHASKGVLLGAYTMMSSNSYEFAALDPAERVRQAVQFGSKIHSQYSQEFENGISVAWHRIPTTLGCFAMWSEEGRDTHYKTVCTMDKRIVLAGEHASYLAAWQEGAIQSGLHAIDQLHRRAVNI